MRKKMAIKKIGNEVKDFLEKAKNRLKKMGEDTTGFAKRSEKDLLNIAKIGKAEIDILTLDIKKYQLYYQLGKDAYRLYIRKRLTARNLKHLCDKIDAVEKDLKLKRRSISKYLKKRR